jgi:hypothetical protein
MALGMFVIAVGGLTIALDRAFSAANLLRREEEVRQQIESLLDESLFLPLAVLEEGREIGPDALGVRYAVGVEPTEEFRNMEDEVLEGMWVVTVRAEWQQGGQKQQWRESFLRYEP